MQFLSNDMYSRLIHSFTIASYKGCEYLDLVNFSNKIYREVFQASVVEEIFHTSYGYGAPDGSDELRPIIRSLEWQRAHKYSNWLQEKFPRTARKILKRAINFDELSAGSGVGTTGVFGVLLKSIFDLETPRHKGKPSVLLCIPNYSVYDGIVRALGGKCEHLLTTEENNFIPTFEQFREAVNEKTLVFVLTYPNNPAQTTYCNEDAAVLADIAAFCQERKIYLVIDNIYQDTIWEEDLLNPEIFSLVEKPDYIYKIFGPSKDRPFYSGLRMGYYVGDPRIAKAYQYHASLYNNTHNNHSSLVFATDLMFRKKMIEETPLNLDDIKLLDTFLAGWSIRIDPVRTLDAFLEREMVRSYIENVQYNNKVQADSLSEITSKMDELPIIGRVVNGNIGNVIFAKVNEEMFSGNCDDFFQKNLDGPKLGILPGNVFGMPEKRGEAWFRITTIHGSPSNIIRRLNTMNNYFQMKCPVE